MDGNIFFIGIDSGGTKTELLIQNKDNKSVFSKKYNSLHYSVHGSDKVSNHLYEIITASLNEAGLEIENCKGICIGLAGAREEEDKNRIKQKVSKLLGFKKIIIESDSVIALQGAFNGEDGLILICGTGSILLGLIENKPVRIGGWGWKLGDFGSGYEIGKYAIKNLIEEYDCGRKPSALSKAIEKKFAIDEKTLLKNIYHKNFNFQNIVPVILEYAGKKDKTASRIIDTAADELLKHFSIFFSLTKYRRNIGLVLSGSILENKNPLSDRVRNKIKKSYTKINIVSRKNSPVKGAILLAKNKFLKN
jgi:N-acetylglucosamine kinase-like BadF-type ATPase